MYYLFYTIFLSLEITQETVLSWFNIEAPLDRKISEYRDLYGLIPTDESTYIQQLQEQSQTASAFSLASCCLSSEDESRIKSISSSLCCASLVEIVVRA